MTHMPRTIAAHGDAQASAGPSHGILRRAWRAYWTRRGRQVTLGILRSLDDRTLRDIGIHPGQIESCIHGRHGQHQRPYDAQWPWRSGG